ncbi:hypothetical protein [Microbacterium aurum]
MPRPAYDAGRSAPAWSEGATGAGMQSLGIEETLEAVDGVVGDWLSMATKIGRARRGGARAMLKWLSGFPGDTWEERWILSGLDSAPRTWKDTLAAQVGVRGEVLTAAMTALLLAGVIRPSYSWLLATKQFIKTGALFLVVNEPEALQRIRALPAYQAANEWSRRNTEMCLVRLLIRTGKRLEQLRGDDLLAYADIVRTSRRSHHEHLAWEVLVALGPLAGEQPTLRAAWGRPLAPASTVSPHWLIAMAFQRRRCGTCSWTTSPRSRTGWTTAHYRASPTGWCGSSGSGFSKSIPTRPT